MRLNIVYKCFISIYTFANGCPIAQHETYRYAEVIFFISLKNNDKIKDMPIEEMTKFSVKMSTYKR